MAQEPEECLTVLSEHLLLFALLHDEESPKPEAWLQCLSLGLEGWVLGFQNPKQGDSTTGRKLFLQMSPRWLIERLNRFKEQDLNNVGRCDQMMDKRR